MTDRFSQEGNGPTNLDADHPDYLRGLLLAHEKVANLAGDHLLHALVDGVGARHAHEVRGTHRRDLGHRRLARLLTEERDLAQEVALAHDADDLVALLAGHCEGANVVGDEALHGLHHGFGLLDLPVLHVEVAALVQCALRRLEERVQLGLGDRHEVERARRRRLRGEAARHFGGDAPRRAEALGAQEGGRQRSEHDVEWWTVLAALLACERR